MKLSHVKPLAILAMLGVNAGAGEPARAVSDHFDGQKFYNPTYPEVNRSFLSGLKLWMTMRKARWPDSVANNPDLRLNENLESKQAAVTFVNHATLLIQLDGLNILTDPVWSDRASPVSWAGPRRVRRPGLAFDSLPRIDCVLLSHNHYDHFDLPTLKRLADMFSPVVFVPLGDFALAKRAGFKKIHEMDWWDGVMLDARTKITFTPTQHHSARGLTSFNKSLWGAYRIDRDSVKIYFGGDAAYSVHFLETRRRMGPSDLAFLSIGAYEPRWFMAPMHMSPSEAVMAHRDLESGQSVGIHFGTFRLSAESFESPVSDLAKAVDSAGVSEKTFHVLEEGRTRIYSF